MFEYDHSLLSLSESHKRGIRTTKEIEEVIEGYSFADEQFFGELRYNVIRFIGFTRNTKALKIACRLDVDGKLITLDARIPKIEEVIDGFCKYC